MKPTQLLPLLAVLLASTATAQNPPPRPPEPEPLVVPAAILTPAQTANILKQLDQLEAQIGQGRGAIFTAALAKFRAAMANKNEALALYLDCYKLENFDHRDLKQTDFKDWRDRNEDRLKDENFTTGLLLQLEYLVLTIQAQDIDNQKKMGPLVTALQAYIPKAVVAVQATMKHTASGALEVKDTGPKGGGGRKAGGGGGGGGSQLAGILRQSVRGTEFSKAYLLDDHFTRKEWEYAPLNVEGMYANVIFPYYLVEKPEELPAQWDARINVELVMRKSALSETEYNLYYKEEQPRLLWEKNTYLLTNNINAVNALADMLKVIRENPNHASAAGWLKEIREVVKSASIPEPGPAPVETSIGK